MPARAFERPAATLLLEGLTMIQNALREGRCNCDVGSLLASQGRHGDTLVAHISPLEAAVLRLLGGSGTINPKTGLPEFYNSSAGGDNGAGTGKADRDAANKGNALGGGRSSGSGKDDGSGASYQGGGPTTSTSGSPGLGAAYGRLGMGLGLNGQPAPAPTTKWGNENAYIGDKYQKAIQGTDASGVVDVISTLLGFTPAAPLGWGLGILNKFGVFKNIGGQSINDQRDTAYGGGGAASGGGISRGNGGRGDSGMPPGDHTAVTQNAQQTNAGGGLLAPPYPEVSPAPGGQALPIGLLQYLAQNPGLLQGLATQSRFGAGSVAPINYKRPYP